MWSLGAICLLCRHNLMSDYVNSDVNLLVFPNFYFCIRLTILRDYTWTEITWQLLFQAKEEDLNLFSIADLKDLSSHQLNEFLAQVLQKVSSSSQPWKGAWTQRHSVCAAPNSGQSTQEEPCGKRNGIVCSFIFFLMPLLNYDLISTVPDQNTF